MHALTLPLAALVTLTLGPASASARFDRLPSHNIAKRAAGAPDHHAMAEHLLHRRDDVSDAIDAISSALGSPTDEADSFPVLAAAAQAAPHQAELGSAYVLVSKASATSSEAAKKEAAEEKAKAKEAAAKKAKARLARIAHSNSVASVKSASSVKRAKSSKAAAKLKSARKAASAKSKSQSVSASRSRYSAAVQSAFKAKSVSKSKATSSKKHASAVKASSLSKSKANASASKSKAAAAKTTAVAKVAKVANTSKAGTILAGVFNLKGLKGFVAINSCGASRADDEYPNGAEDWLNCGISRTARNSPWTPPAGVTIDRLAYVSLETAMATNPIWAPCKPYISLFEKWGAATGLPPILLASFAMQESTCNANESGDSGGAFGLMQITKDKCEGRDTAGCNDPDFNIMTGAKYFASQLEYFGGNVLLALGQYNGWYDGLTYDAATAAAYTGCCECQNNLDYMHQMLNGWMQGKTGYEMGSIGNLDVCGE